ncbi:MAG: hypothetical protein GQF41_1324 [Candidatus Rifleibacterium amylolyticum]|nr:MAG: hypothetical protein GQF41_1324 [Candidatus Rifleibacterium amylolyticum]
MTDTDKRKCMANWLMFAFFAVVVPLLVAWQTFVYLEKLHAESSLRRYQIKAADMLENLRVSADANLYVCSLMNHTFQNAKNPRLLKKDLEELRNSSGMKFEYIIWDKNGGIHSADFDWRSTGADMRYAWQTLTGIGRRKIEVADASSTSNLRKIFGPQFFPELYQRCYSGRNISLILSDSSLQKKLSWIRMRSSMGLAAFFDHDVVKGLPGLKFFISTVASSSEMKVGVVNAEDWLGLGPSDFSKSEMAAISSSYENPVRIRDWYVFKNALRKDLCGICYISADSIERLAVNKWAWLLIGFLMALALYILWRSYRVICCGSSLSLNIRKQLIILFVLSNAISLLIMALIGHDYLGQYRLYLQTESFSKGVTFLQNIDEMFVGEYSRQLRRMRKSLGILEKRLKNHRPDRNNIMEFLNAQSGDHFRLFLIGSTTPYIGSELGIMKDGKFVEEIHIDWARYKSMQTLVDSMGKLGQYYLALLNRKPISEMMMAQVELIAESLGQLRPLEMFQEFFAATGSFWQWGMGFRYFPAYIDLLRDPDSGLANYVFLYLWNADRLHRHYINQLITDFNRNPIGIKVMAVDENFFYSNPPELLENQQLRLYSAKLRERSGVEIEFCDWEGEQHLLMGLKCTSIDTIRLIGLYPASAIDRKVTRKQQIFVALAIVSILVSLAMGLFVSRSILIPLAELQRGIAALQQRDFAFRLADLGGDEFGNLARVFNTTLVDLEELQVASTVQEKLSDNMSEVAHSGCLKWFAASSSQYRFAGDYLAVEQISAEKVMILLGDVAGSGIGVSLIVAFVKAALLQLKQLYDRPEQLLLRLDFLLRELSNRAGRKCMTMQCALLDCQKAEVIVANAGHCFPVRVNLIEGNAKVVEMPSTPLATGSRVSCSVKSFNLQPGESMILYSGGFYRSCENGFADFIKDLVQLGNCCPKKWYETVIAAVNARIDASAGRDDMTMVVISFNEKSERENACLKTPEK